MSGLPYSFDYPSRNHDEENSTGEDLNNNLMQQFLNSYLLPQSDGFVFFNLLYSNIMYTNMCV